MARYFFHLRDGTDELLDPEGVELATLDEVKVAALEAARDTLSHEIKCGVLNLKPRLEVEDASGTVVHVLKLTDAFEVIEQSHC
jgi:uncharacterized protein YxjI